MFERARSVPVLLFAYDRWGSHSMPNATTKTLTERLYRSRHPQVRSVYIYITFIWLATAAFRFVFIERRALRCCGHVQRNYQNFDRTAIPLKKSLSRELLHIYTFNLASVRVSPALFQRAPSIAVWFVDVFRCMANATTKTLTKRLFR
jgi:hypothetical protein